MKAKLVIVLVTVLGTTTMPVVTANHFEREGKRVATGQLEDVLASNWRDGEIRVQYLPSTQETQLSVGILPASPHGTLTFVLSARLRQRAPTEPPSTLQARIGVGLRVNPNAIRRPVLSFVLDPKTPRATTIEASDRLRLLDLDPTASLENASATITLVEFIQLLRAEVITGQILGLSVSFSREQREALQEFGLRVLRRAQ